MPRNQLTTSQPRVLATGAYRAETESALSEVRSTRSQLLAEMRSLQSQDADLAFLQDLLENDLVQLDHHLKAAQ